MGNTYALEYMNFSDGNSYALETTRIYLMGNSYALENALLLYIPECLPLDISTDRTYESISQNLRCQSVCYLCDCCVGLCDSTGVYYLLCR
jgi:hypothetical protein